MGKPKIKKDNIDYQELWYVHFNFYYNSESEIEEFKKKIKKMHPFIVAFKKSNQLSGFYFLQQYKLLVYCNSQEECDKITNNSSTKKLYKKYVGDGGYKINN